MVGIVLALLGLFLVFSLSWGVFPLAVVGLISRAFAVQWLSFFSNFRSVVTCMNASGGFLWMIYLFARFASARHLCYY